MVTQDEQFAGYANRLDDAARSLEEAWAVLGFAGPDALFDRHGRLVRELREQAAAAGQRYSQRFGLTSKTPGDALSEDARRLHGQLRARGRESFSFKSLDASWHVFRELRDGGYLEPAIGMAAPNTGP